MRVDAAGVPLLAYVTVPLTMPGIFGSRVKLAHDVSFSLRSRVVFDGTKPWADAWRFYLPAVTIAVKMPFASVVTFTLAWTIHSFAHALGLRFGSVTYPAIVPLYSFTTTAMTWLR